MNYEEWQLKRRELAEVERKERSENWQQSRAPLQASITEQAVRELYRKVEELKDELSAVKYRVEVRSGKIEPRKSPDEAA